MHFVLPNRLATLTRLSARGIRNSNIYRWSSIGDHVPLDYAVGFGEHQDIAIKNRVSWWLSYSKRDQAIEEESGSEAP